MELLNTEQKLIFDKYKNGENVFLTGPGGTGKSYLIKTIVKDAGTDEKTLQVCALTGCASILLNCKATTLHRFAGFGLANKPINEVVEEVFKKKYKLKNWFKLKCLIIDEVSMMSQKNFEILDGIGRSVRKMKSHLPFGGIQIVFQGNATHACI